MTQERRRGAELEETILAAVLAELAEVGYARLTMEAVAARARTGKQVLYRRWRNRAELVVAAVRHRGGSIADRIPDTGALRADVLAVLGVLARRREEIGVDVVHGLLAEVPDLDPGLFTIMRGVMTTILKRAVERGEITTADVPPRVVTLPIDLFRYQQLLTRDPIEESTLTEITDDVFLPLLFALAGRGKSRVAGC
ncbi:TetR/AcrR family transcriptional regulator [Actinophytocola sp.]|uniref:TetR/AcrR family transcriptional regulator n=1 Tax=Actinophytocola sp. TaxID=1872138 RepID=UPI0038999A51